jgi:hypothetical protein
LGSSTDIKKTPVGHTLALGFVKRQVLINIELGATTDPSERVMSLTKRAIGLEVKLLSNENIVK